MGPVVAYALWPAYPVKRAGHLAVAHQGGGGCEPRFLGVASLSFSNDIQGENEVNGRH